MPNFENNSFKAAAEGYLEDGFAAGNLVLEEIQRQAGQIGIDGALGESIALIPVAEDESEKTILHAAGVYEDQDRPTGGLSVVLGLNRTVLYDPDSAERTKEAAFQAKDEHPDLDLRVVQLGGYSMFKDDFTEKDCLIPEIRRDLTAVVLKALVEQEDIPQEVLFHMHDIDLVSLSDEFFVKMKEAHLQNPGMPLMPNGRHALYPDKPNLNVLISLSDLDGIFSHNQPPIFEAAAAIPGTTYLEADGYNGHRTKRAGTKDLLSRTGVWPVHVDAELQSSSRRQASKFLNGLSVVWGVIPGEGPFETDDLDDYRSKDFPDKNRIDNYALYTWSIPNILDYQNDAKEYVENLAHAGLGFEDARNKAWSWVKERFGAAQPRIEEVDELYRSAHIGEEELMSFEQFAKWRVHGAVIDALARKYETRDLDALVKGGMQEIHEAHLEHTSRAIHASQLFERNAAGDLFKLMYYRKVHELEGTEPLIKSNDKNNKVFADYDYPGK